MEKQMTENMEDKTIKPAKPKYYYAGLGLLAAIVLILLIVLGLTFYRAEKKFASDGFTMGIAKMFGLPAGFVNANRISYVEFMQDLQAMEESYKNVSADQAALKPTKAEMRKNVWDMLAKNAVVRQEASKNNVMITTQEVEAEYANLVKTVGTEAQAEELIKTNYGWGVAQFKQSILRPFVLQQKLSLSPGIAEKLNQEPKARAEEVLKQVQEGKKSFEDLAKEFGEDGTKDTGGDLGWFGKGVMIKEFEDAVSNLEPGKISGLVQTSFGYHVIKLEEKRVNAKNETEWRAKHILIKTGDFDTYLSDLVKKARVWKWISL